MAHEADHLSPLRVRLIAFAAMVVVALGAIWLIDRRAMMKPPMPHAQPPTAMDVP